jgi:hypothetical protein
MKRIVLGLLVMSCLSFQVDQGRVEMELSSKYEQGWADGFCEGWRDVKGQLALCPLVPLCPLPKMECSEGYRCGYNRGFKYGMCKARGGSCQK